MPRGYNLTSDQGQRPVGVYIPVDATGENVTVFWRGNVGRNTFVRILSFAEVSFGPTGVFQENVVVYGKDKKTFGPDASGLARVLIGLDFDACRAELSNERGKLVLWANVQQGEMVVLEDGGENIGLSFPVELFDFVARTVITFAIKRTMAIGSKESARVLSEVDQLVHKVPVTG
jgi:hypothetical protein